MNKFLLVLFAALLAVGAHAEEFEQTTEAEMPETFDAAEAEFEEPVADVEEEEESFDEEENDADDEEEDDSEDDAEVEADAEVEDDDEADASSLAAMERALKSPTGVSRGTLGSFASEVKRIKRKLKSKARQRNREEKRFIRRIGALARKISKLKKKIAKATKKVAVLKRKAAREARRKAAALKAQLRAKLAKFKKSMRFLKRLHTHVKGLKGTVLVEESDDASAIHEELEENAEELAEVTDLDVSAELSAAKSNSLYKTSTLKRLVKKMLSALKRQISALKSALRNAHKRKKNPHVQALLAKIKAWKAELARLLAKLKALKKAYAKFKRLHLHLGKELVKLDKIESHIYTTSSGRAGSAAGFKLAKKKSSKKGKKAKKAGKPCMKKLAGKWTRYKKDRKSLVKARKGGNKKRVYGTWKRYVGAKKALRKAIKSSKSCVKKAQEEAEAEEEE